MFKQYRDMYSIYYIFNPVSFTLLLFCFKFIYTFGGYSGGYNGGVVKYHASMLMGVCKTNRNGGIVEYSRMM